MDFYNTLLLKKSSGGDGGETHAAFKAYADGTLTTVTEKMLNGITALLDAAFQECVSLTSITIPESVTSIWENSFQNCPLKSVTVKRAVPPTLGSGAFNSASNDLKIYVPAESVNAYKTADGWEDYASKIQAIPS